MLQSAIIYLSQDSGCTYVPAANEGAAVGIATGATLAGQQSVVLTDNSGIGNLVNPLTTLLLPYEIPILLIIGVRAYPNGKGDEPQHRVMGATIQRLLDLYGVRYWELPHQRSHLPRLIEGVTHEVTSNRKVSAILVRNGTLEGPHGLGPISRLPVARSEAISLITQSLSRDEAVVSTTGKISRELFALRDRPNNFYMEGSMGHAMAIGLGLALAMPDRKVWILDGDGAVLMHMGSMSTIGCHASPNLIHVILDNEVYESTGGQPTTSARTKFDLVARACGYRHVRTCTTLEDIKESLDEVSTASGPHCLIMKVDPQATLNAPRITTKYTAQETREIFSESCQSWSTLSRT